MAGHPDGTITEMTEALKGQYGEHAGDMAVVLRGYAGYFLDHPEELDAGEDGQAGMPGGGRGAQAEPAGRPADERSR